MIGFGTDVEKKSCLSKIWDLTDSIQSNKRFKIPYLVMCVVFLDFDRTPTMNDGKEE